MRPTGPVALPFVLYALLVACGPSALGPEPPAPFDPGLVPGVDVPADRAAAAPGTHDVMLVVRTAQEPPEDEPESLSLCLHPGTCLAFDSSDAAALRDGRVDHFRYEVDDDALRAMRTLTLERRSGAPSRPWVPDCVALVVDGALRYCRDGLAGEAPADGDVMRWREADATRVECAGCYGSPVTHGPLLGATTGTTALVWLRTAWAVPVSIVWGLAEDLSDGRASDTVLPAMHDDFAVTLRITGLPPGRRVYYRVLADGAPAGPVRSFGTAPEPGAEVRVAFGSCTNALARPDAPIFDRVSEARPDVLLMLGDNHYANSTATARLETHFRRSREVPQFASLVAATPTWAIWDDHDYAGNDLYGPVPGREASLEVFRRYWANGAYASDGAPGVWSRQSWGDVDVFLLDTRWYREAPGGSMLGATQRAWLERELLASRAPVKLLASSSQWTTEGSSDSWAQYDREREELLDFVMHHRIGGVVLLSGDVHRGELRQLRPGGPHTYEIWELTSSPFNTKLHPCITDRPSDELQVCAAKDRNFGLVTVATRAQVPAVKLELVAEDGRLLAGVEVPLERLAR